MVTLFHHGLSHVNSKKRGKSEPTEAPISFLPGTGLRPPNAESNQRYIKWAYFIIWDRLWEGTIKIYELVSNLNTNYRDYFRIQMAFTPDLLKVNDS